MGLSYIICSVCVLCSVWMCGYNVSPISVRSVRFVWLLCGIFGLATTTWCGTKTNRTQSPSGAHTHFSGEHLYIIIFNKTSFRRGRLPGTPARLKPWIDQFVAIKLPCRPDASASPPKSTPSKPTHTKTTRKRKHTRRTPKNPCTCWRVNTKCA